MSHTPVFVKEAIQALNVQKDKRYIDATFGEGGHSLEILKRGGQVLGIDRDDQNLQSKVYKVGRRQSLQLVRGNFAEIEKIARESGFFPVSGVLFDLGLSMRQIRRSGRGFSYERPDEPLDMRMDSRSGETAADIINHSSADQLYEILAGNSEEINSRAIADALYQSRLVKETRTVGDLLAVIDRILPKLIGSKEGIVRRVFQALRIEVNQELANLKKALPGAVKLLAPRGRLAVITFHQGEDRVVKQFVRDKKLTTIGKKPITAKGEKTFERSAKLRVIQAN